VQVQLNKPELEKFIGEQIKAGNFPSADTAGDAFRRNIIQNGKTPPQPSRHVQ